MSDNFTLEDIYSDNKETAHEHLGTDKVDSNNDNDTVITIPSELESKYEEPKTDISDFIDLVPDINSKVLVDNSEAKLNERLSDNGSDNGELNLFACKCRECGTSFITSCENDNFKCAYCGSIYCEHEKTRDDDLYIIPFSKTQNDCIFDYKSKVKNPLLPLKFRNKNIIKSINKVYIPSLVLNFNVSGNVIFLAGDREKKDKKIETKKYKNTYEVNFDFIDYPVNLWTKIDEKTFNNINNYDFDKIVKLNEKIDLINNDSFIKEDLSESEANDMIHSKVLKSSSRIVREVIEHQLKKLENNGVKVDYSSAKKVLLPVYFLNVKYMNKDYIYIMNGENGNSFLNKIYSKISIIVVSLIIFSIIFLLSFLLAYFL